MDSTTAERLSFRPTVVTVDLKILEQNVKKIVDFAAPAKVMTVVKSNAYGHGLIESAKAFLRGGASSLGVALVEEGIELRSAGITAPILVFGGIFGDQIELYLRNQLDCTASSIDKLKAIDAVAKSMGITAQVHLKIDTGMGRIGVQHQNCEPFFKTVAECPHCNIRGIFSHFATADEDDTTFMHLQLARFQQCKKVWQSLYPELKPTFHMANSAATEKLKESHFDMVRPGLLCYGITQWHDSLPVAQAYSLKSRIVYFKVLQKGDSVAYGRTWIAPRQTRIVTIPIGYGDGYSRSLSGKSHVLIRGKKYPIVGRICMDQIMVDIGQDQGFNGDEVVLIGRQLDQEITIKEIAAGMNSIEHEVLTSVNHRVPRVYY